MKRFVVTAVVLFGLFSASFALFEHAGWLTGADVRAWIEGLRASPTGFFTVAGAVFALLLVDILLPVPSSVVMTAAGAVLGAWAGTIAAFLGAMGAAVTAFWACRLGGRPAFERITGGEEMQRVTRWFEHSGVFAIVLSRPVPMLTEVLSCLAGLSRMRFSTFSAAAVLGTLPICLVYAAAGAYGTLSNPWPAVILALGVPALGWVGLRIARNDRCHDWARLFRLPNLATVPGTAVGGLLLAAATASGKAPVFAHLVPLTGVVLGLLAVYAGGVALNDVVDAERDAADRPDRPIPAGRIPRRRVARVAAELLILGPVFAVATAGWQPGLCVTAVAALAALYDVVHAKCPFGGVLLMGACRAGSWLCGAAIIGVAEFANPLVLGAPVGAFAFTSVVTALALGEATKDRLGRQATLPGEIAAVLLIGAFLGLRSAGAGLWPLAVFAVAIGENALAAHAVMYGGNGVPPFIGRSIRVLGTLQCAWTATALAVLTARVPGFAPGWGWGAFVALVALRLVAEFASRRVTGS